MKQTRKLLDDVASGKMTPEEAEKKLYELSIDNIGGLALLDVNRGTRSGIPEIVFGESKTPEDIIQIITNILKAHNVVLVTRLTQEKLDFILSNFKDENIEVHGKNPILTALVHTDRWKEEETGGKIAVITAGTSDIPYAKEAEALARLVGVEVYSYYDVGVSGIHRLIEPIKEIREKDVDALIVFAGMEGALPTVVAALVDIPVIGVPVPTGYGFGGRGETALASMLQSCSPGLSVVNIGNGIGAASVASLIAKRVAKYRS
ncbi:MAG: nickel pincer cofactor biosynthesis protein LarB [Candidatus Thorarchaeota archaeon]